MPITLTPGTRLFSAVDSTELIVVRAPSGPVDLTIGGHRAVLSLDERAGGAPVDGHDAGASMGKRYVDADGRVELLVTKPGNSSPALDGVLLSVKDAKPLPASD